MRAATLVVAVALVVAGCSEGGLSPKAEQGRTTYLSHCVACHNADPSQTGPVGPPVKGASRELLGAKVLKGTYPPGYTPKRPTNVMVPIPAVAQEIDALAEYLH